MIFLWVNKRSWKHPGPIVNIGVRNAHSFASIGCETHFCVGENDAENDDARDAKNRADSTDFDLQKFYGLSPKSSLHIHRIARWKLGKSRLSVPIFLRAARLANELSRRDHVALITRETGFLPYLARLVRRNPRISGFYEAHDFFADLSWKNRDEIKLADRRLRWLERRFLPRISGLICITREQQKLYRQLFPNLPSCAAPLGTEVFEKNESGSGGISDENKFVDEISALAEKRRALRRIVYVGHLHGSKGVSMLIKATPRLAEKNVRIAFWGGSEKQIAKFKKQVEKLGASSFVEFAGFRPPEELHRALANEASIGVVPLQDTFYNRYLTCPVKALDYLSHGLPAVGSDLPSVREVLADAARYAPPNDSDALIANVLALLDDAALYDAASAAARARARELSWPERAKKLARFVEESAESFSEKIAVARGDSC